MAELCLICRKRMWVGETYRISTTYDNSLVGYVHQTCFNKKKPMVKTVKW
jgi:hypothetical protein